MAFIPVPATAQFKAFGTVGGNPWVNIFHYHIVMTSGNITTAVLNAMCNKWQSDLSPRVTLDWPSSHTFQGVTAVDLSNTTPATGASTGGTFTGGATGIQDAAACLLVNLRTSSRYRGGHGRLYLPGPVSIQQANATQWSSSTVSTWNSVINLMISDTANAGVTAGASSVQMCIPRYQYQVTNDTVHQKYIRTKILFDHNDFVNNPTVNANIRTQRRRLGGR